MPSVRSAAVLLLLGLGALCAVGCGGEQRPARSAAATVRQDALVPEDGYTGSRSCRECHQRFYELWAPSHHGLAMQPFSVELAQAEFAVHDEDTVIGEYAYRVEFDDDGGWVREQGPDGQARHAVEHVMGGKNVYFLLTAMAGGRLQVLPVAYDIDDKLWYDTTDSMVRHAAGDPDEAVHWTDPLLTFNTSCWNCHVSQLSVNYDAKTATYDSVWAEPGINCETCHGPGGEHVAVCRAAPAGEVPDDLEIIIVRNFTADQVNDTCAPCHAKAAVISTDFEPGRRYFDHFDLACLEDPDFYVDGRDLGENYTFTSWRMNRCAQSGQLDCVHCHTSSGRYRFVGERTNEACLPCHQERVEDVVAHSHHDADGPGSRCVACHMPMTEFARMRRSDHSMRPPAPSLTVAHGSPNACNLCHTDRDAAWADEHVRAWRTRDYQLPILRRAALVAAARKGDWSRLGAMLADVVSEDREEVHATSLIRLLAACPDVRKVRTFIQALQDPSPLVRSAAAAGLDASLDANVIQALLGVLDDEYRLVRIRAAGALAGVPLERVQPDVRGKLEAALAELETSLTARPDAWSSHYNLGIFHEQRGDVDRALAEYEKASDLRPDVVAPWVNAAMVQARQGRLERAETSLRRALEVEPQSAAANFNLGLLLSETGRVPEAKQRLRRAFEHDPTLAAAACNLGILVAPDDIAEAVAWCRRAYEARPELPRYAFTYAFYLKQAGDMSGAVKVLQEAIARGMTNASVYHLLGEIYEERGQAGAAKAVYRRAVDDDRLQRREREEFYRRAVTGR